VDDRSPRVAVLSSKDLRLVLVRIEKSESSRAHFIDRALLHEVLAGAHTRFVPRVQANEPDASGQLIVKPLKVRTLCGQEADPVTLSPFDARYCQACVARAGAGTIVAAVGFRK
jgi:hypothetical protein